MAEFVSKNNYFEFNSNAKCQICVTVIGTKFSPPYACIDYMENQFFKNEQIQPWIWFRYFDDNFSFGQLVEDDLMISWYD